MAVGPALQATGRFGMRTIGRIAGWGLLSLFLVFIIVNAIMISVQERSIQPAITDLGGRFVFITDRINTLALEIIEREGIYEKHTNPFRTIGSFIWKHLELFANLYMCYVWIKIWIKLYGWSPLSTESNKFINLLLALITFFVLQWIFILAFVDPVQGMTKPDQLEIPYMAFVNLGKSMPYLLSPFQRMGDMFPGFEETVVENGTLTSEAFNQTEIVQTNSGGFRVV